MTLIKFTYSLLHSLVSAAAALLLGSSRAVLSDWIFLGNISNHIAHLVAANPPPPSLILVSVLIAGRQYRQVVHFSISGWARGPLRELTRANTQARVGPDLLAVMFR